MTVREAKRGYKARPANYNWMASRIKDGDLDTLIALRAETRIPLTVLIARAVHLGTKPLIEVLTGGVGLDQDVGDIIRDVQENYQQ